MESCLRTLAIGSYVDRKRGRQLTPVASCLDAIKDILLVDAAHIPHDEARQIRIQVFFDLSYLFALLFALRRPVARRRSFAARLAVPARCQFRVQILRLGPGLGQRLVGG